MNTPEQEAHTMNASAQATSSNSTNPKRKLALSVIGAAVLLA